MLNSIESSCWIQYAMHVPVYHPVADRKSFPLINCTQKPQTDGP